MQRVDLHLTGDEARKGGDVAHNLIRRMITEPLTQIRQPRQICLEQVRSNTTSRLLGVMDVEVQPPQLILFDKPHIVRQLPRQDLPHGVLMRPHQAMGDCLLNSLMGGLPPHRARLFWTPHVLYRQLSLLKDRNR